MARRTRRGRGEGSVYFDESMGLWVGSIVVGHLTRPDGTQRPKRKKVYDKDKGELLKKLAEEARKYREGAIDDSTVTLKQCLDDLLDTVIKPRVDPATYQLHRQRANDYILKHLGHIHLQKLQPWNVREFFEQLEKQGCSSDLRNKAGQLLRRCVKFAIQRGVIVKDPTREHALPKVVVKQMEVLDEAQVKRFLALAQANRLYPLYLLALDTGMRQGELIALEWTDIDLEAGIVSITKSARTGDKRGTEDKGGARIKEVKTRSSRRRIRLTRPTMEALRAWKLKTPGRIVFPSRGRGATRGQARYLNKGNLRKALQRLLKEAGVPVIRFHDLRHTHATLALAKGVNLKVLSVRLGHADIKETLDTYVHYIPAMDDQLLTVMEALLTPSEAA